MTRTHRLLLRAVLANVVRPKVALGVTLTIVAISVAFAWARLTVSANQNELFSPRVKFFRDFLEFNKKFPENEALYVVIEAKGDEKAIAVARWTAAADAVAGALRPLKNDVSSVDQKVPLEQLGRQGILFDEPGAVQQNFAEMQQFLGLIRFWAEPATSPTDGRTPSRFERFLSYISLTQSGSTLLRRVGVHVAENDLGELLRVLAESWTESLKQRKVVLPDLESLAATDPQRLGYYYEPDETKRDRHLLLVRVYLKEKTDSLTAISETVENVRVAIQKASAQFPEFTFGTTGRPALDADEMRTTDDDSHKAEVVAMIAVFIGLVVLLRSFWLALAAELALGVGIGWTFGWATVAVGRLNLLSVVFLLALIGIGMDYLVQILSRYRQEALRRQHPHLIWIAVFRQVGAPINTACLGAAGAFLVSILTDFRGAAELGIIAGGGLLLCLIAGYTFLPALLTIFPSKIQAQAYDPAAVRQPAAKPKGMRWLLLPAIWIALLLIGSKPAKRTTFNPGLLELQAQGLPSVQLIRKLESWYAVVLSKDLETLRRARDAVARSPLVQRTESVLTAYDNAEWLRENYAKMPAIEWSDAPEMTAADLPIVAELCTSIAGSLPPATQPTQSDGAAALRRFAEAVRGADPATAAQVLSGWQRGFVQQIREELAQFNPEPVDLAKVPIELRSHLVSGDGTYALYVYPTEDLWQQPALVRFVKDVESRLSKIKGEHTVTGIAPDIYHSTRSIRKSFYTSAGVALLLIVILVWLDMRRVRNTLLAVSVLAVGLPMLVAIMGLSHIDWNFANFFALPILIGAGHEYGVFMVHRYAEVVRDPRRTWRGFDVADKALLACAYVTSTSFGFFWLLGRHQGLRSLGWVMAVGTLCIYLSTVGVVRPILMWRLERRAKRVARRAEPVAP